MGCYGEATKRYGPPLGIGIPSDKRFSQEPRNPDQSFRENCRFPMPEYERHRNNTLPLRRISISLFHIYIQNKVREKCWKLKKTKKSQFPCIFRHPPSLLFFSFFHLSMRFSLNFFIGLIFSSTVFLKSVSLLSYKQLRVLIWTENQN